MEISEIILNKLRKYDKLFEFSSSELDMILKNNSELKKLFCFYADRLNKDQYIFKNKIRNNFFTINQENIKCYEKKRKMKEKLIKQIEHKKNQINLNKIRRKEINFQKHTIMKLIKNNEQLEEDYFFKIKTINLGLYSLAKLGHEFKINNLISNYRYIRTFENEFDLSENELISQNISNFIETELHEENFMKLPRVSI